jgi:uncharacterized protein YutE (UPF0331/DUF86 family)
MVLGAEKLSGLEFFERLCADYEFCQALGRMTLAAGRFESNLRAFLKLNGVEVLEKEATLGSLIAKLKKHNLLSANGVESLRTLKRQRNYFTHSLFDLLSERIEETILSRTNLIPLDVYAYIDYVVQLEENLNGLSSIVVKRIAELTIATGTSGDTDRLLFRP